MRAGILICLCVGVSAVASAEWKVGPGVPGEPRDVRAWGHERVALAHSTGAELFENEAQVAFRFLSPAVGTLLTSTGCFAGVHANGTLYAYDSCLPDSKFIPEIPTSTVFEVRRVMQTQSGSSYAAITVDTNEILVLGATPSGTGVLPWNTRILQTSQFRATSVMGVTDTAGAVPHALLQVVGPPNLIYVRGDQRLAEFSVPTALTTLPFLTLDLFATSGPHPVALLGNEDGLFRGQLTSGVPPNDTFQRVTLHGSGPVSITSVDLTTEQGSARGTGFGLAVGVDSNGEPVVLGAVPTASAADSGTTWRIHPAFAGASLPVSAPFNQVSCVDPTFCVLTLSNIEPNVIYYSNAAAPVFGSFPDPVLIDERTTRTLDITATDPDGDAVRVSVDAAQSTLNVSATPRPDAVTLTLTAPEVCEPTTTQLTVFAADGLGTHDRQTTVNVRVENTAGPATPRVQPAQASTSAGGPSRVFTASPGAGLCESVDYVWSSPPGQPVLVTEGNGGSATFVPPEFLCAASGARYTYEVRARDRGQTPSPPTTFSVDVQPWGRPSAPFAPDAVRRFTSGESVEVRPDFLHPCAGTQALPEVQTVWRLADGSTTVPAGLTVRDDAGAAVDLSAPVTARALQVSAEGCASASLTFSVRNRLSLQDGTVLEGPEAWVKVEAAPAPEDVSAASLDLSMQLSGGQDAEARLGTSLRCPGVHALKARMFLESASGEPLASDVVPVPGVWRFTLPAVCSQTPFTVRGELFSDGPTPVEAGRARETFTAQARPVALGELDGEALVARCGEGATARLTQEIPADACSEVSLSWSRESGPALTQESLSGPSVTLSTRETGLQDLVGESLTLRVTASASGGGHADRVHSVPIVADPFVDVRHETEAAAGQETGLVGVVVALRNTTACDVTGLRYVEHVEGMDVVPGSVRVAGQSLAEQATEGGFSVEGVSLPAHAQRTLTYVARPRLLGSSRFSGEVFLKGVPVSGPLDREPPSSCGCSQGGSGAALFGLLAVARLLRRRREG
ncbi:hypothetical protein [Myxococcus sp. AB025B]|uniref:hypothetical protein n=1 Tax=Myxococcus sp. AB025B TaxID=2562794 RepID=UPI0011413BF9|nr:hypothetical protein [Myxococcus sp. AB025B]